MGLRRELMLAAMLTILGAAVAGCPADEQTASTVAKTGGTALAPRPATPDEPQIPLDPQAAEDPARRPQPPRTPPAEVAVRAILIKYDTARGAAGIKRTEEQAQRRAERLVQAARKRGSDVAELARKYSDRPAGERDLIERIRPESSAAYADAAFAMGVGQVSDPQPSPTGFFVVERVEPDEYSTAHILIMYKGAELAPVGFKRSKEDAAKLADRVLAKAVEPGNSFSILAARNSDSPSGKKTGGVIAPLIPGKLHLKGFEPYLEAARATKPGEVHTKVVETPYGYHVIKRLPLQKILVQHMLVAYRGSEGTPKEPRTKAAAQALAIQLRNKVRKGEDFDDLARRYSEDAGSAARGGRLQPFARGEMVPRFEQFAFALRPGQISDLVDTRYGFHVIKRLR